VLNEKLVSVVIPTYKRAEGLLRAVNSVLTQSYSNIEVIVVDDNNPDTVWRKETSSKMSLFAENPHVKYLMHDRNINGSAARNTGLNHAKGDFVCFLDDDDFFYADKIKKQVSFFNDYKGFDACFCDYNINGIACCVKACDDYTKNIFLARETPQTSGWMISMGCLKKLQGFDESYTRHQDYEFLLRFFKSGFRMGKVNEVLYERTQTEIDNTPSGKKRELMKKKLFQDFQKQLEILFAEDPSFKRFFYPQNYVPVLTSYLRNGCIVDSVRILLLLMAHSPILTLMMFTKRFFCFLKMKV